mgnify:CR=1 FL=1
MTTKTEIIYMEEQNIVSIDLGTSKIGLTIARKDGRTAGSLGLIGPVRLDYAKIIPYIEYITDKISEMLSEGGEDEPPIPPALENKNR